MTSRTGIVKSLTIKKTTILIGGLSITYKGTFLQSNQDWFILGATRVYSSVF